MNKIIFIINKKNIIIINYYYYYKLYITNYIPWYTILAIVYS